MSLPASAAFYVSKLLNVFANVWKKQLRIFMQSCSHMSRGYKLPHNYSKWCKKSKIYHTVHSEVFRKIPMANCFMVGKRSNFSNVSVPSLKFLISNKNKSHGLYYKLLVVIQQYKQSKRLLRDLQYLWDWRYYPAIFHCTTQMIIITHIILVCSATKNGKLIKYIKHTMSYKFFSWHFCYRWKFKYLSRPILL